MNGCAECARWKHQIGSELAELRDLRRKLHRVQGDGAHLHRELIDRQTHLDETTQRYEEHQDTCAATTAPKPVKVARAKKVDDRPRCPVCRKPVSALPTGYLRRHTDKQGYPCSNVRPEIQESA